MKWNKLYELAKYVRGVTTVNVITVPKTPYKIMYKKYLKNAFLLILYPAANIIGGRIHVKNTSSLNSSVFEIFD